MLASFFPVLLIADLMPLVPPIGFMMLLSWRMVRPGLLPIWAGAPLGAFDDLFSGQPFGCAVLLWSLAMIAMELVESRFPWRGFWQDWIVAALALMIYGFACVALSGGEVTAEMVLVALPQIAAAMLFYPFVSRIIAVLDHFRLLRTRKIG
jgi:rod shape-determining protein MreD